MKSKDNKNNFSTFVFPDSESCSCPIQHSKKNIRLSSVFSDYHNGLISKKEALSLYPLWVSQKDYIILGKPDYTQPIPPRSGGTYCPISEINKYAVNDYLAILLSKRGNAKYSWEVRQRFKPLSFLCHSSKDKDVSFLEPTSSKNHFRCSFLWETFTYDVNRCSSDTAWNNIGNEFNLYLSKLKQKYGKISILRCFESFKNGYPHIHSLIYYHDYKFLVKKYRTKKGKISYIVVSQNKKQKGKQKHDIDYLRSFWHSYIKCTAVKDLGAVVYTLKYITKEMYAQRNYETSANLWLHRKRSYSMSKDFVSTISGLCNLPLLDIKTPNSNTMDEGWFYIGVFKPSFDYDEWYFQLKEPPQWSKFDKHTDLETVFAEVF